VTVNAEVGIRSQDYRLREDLGHPDETDVCQASAAIVVFLQESENGFEVGAKIEANDDCPAPQQGTETGATAGPEQMTRFGRCGFAGSPRWGIKRLASSTAQE